MILKPPVSMIKLHMSCIATSNYFITLPHCHNERKYNIQDHLANNLKLYNDTNLQI